MVKQSDMPPIQAVAVAPLLCRADYRDAVHRMISDGIGESVIAESLSLSRCLVHELRREQAPLFGRRPATKELGSSSATPHAAVTTCPIFEAE